MSGLASSPHASAAQPHEAGDGTMEQDEAAVEIAQTAHPFALSSLYIYCEIAKFVKPRLQASMALQTCAF